ncbi:TorD/DmsD family molecular chaperone [Adlercreutzia shanghongiae]|uniref:Molecular chaperone TorD family protein n=1 Tax=Adlercreutzia shanghongiae TaxID=3111773 RepID=A0ABU6J1C3_9ACTN|nr:molecular chaperone TorD family protein [Adlercreutzia sp. R22]MEC4295738.1 molecular chaperone TorD family protein [Adlercreutzia sp. R22]
MEEKLTVAQTREIMGQRAAIYEFLSIAFGEELPLAFLRSLREQGPALDGELGTFIASLADADDAALEAVRIDLAAEYARIFLGMSRRPVAPYESVYTSPTGLMMQEARDEAVAFYRREGFSVDENIHLPEDHIAFELGFMAGLIRNAMAALDSGNGAEAERLAAVQESFIADHLASWVPSLAQDVENRAVTGFYRGLAALMRDFVEAEADDLAPSR